MGLIARDGKVLHHLLQSQGRDQGFIKKGSKFSGYLMKNIVKVRIICS